MKSVKEMKKSEKLEGSMNDSNIPQQYDIAGARTRNAPSSLFGRQVIDAVSKSALAPRSSWRRRTDVENGG